MWITYAGYVLDGVLCLFSLFMVVLLFVVSLIGCLFVVLLF